MHDEGLQKLFSMKYLSLDVQNPLTINKMLLNVKWFLRRLKTKIIPLHVFKNLHRMEWLKENCIFNFPKIKNILTTYHINGNKKKDFRSWKTLLLFNSYYASGSWILFWFKTFLIFLMLVSNFFRFNTLPATYNFKAERRDKFDTLNMGTKDRVSDGHILFQITLIKKNWIWYL